MTREEHMKKVIQEEDERIKSEATKPNKPPVKKKTEDK